MLAVAGAVLLAGGLLHPSVAHDHASEMMRTAENPLWSPEHWAITFAQALALVALALAGTELHRVAPLPAVAVAGLASVAFGLALGTLGTLVAATGVKSAATSGDLALYTAIALTDLALGWTCLVLTTFGGVLVGIGARVEAAGARVRRAAGAGAVLSGILLAATLAVPYDHGWTHQFLLRGGAALLGLLLLALAVAWPRVLAARRPTGTVGLM